MASMIADALIGKNLGWKFEYLTGGYANRDIEGIKEIAKHISEIYKEKIWVNLGVLDEKEMDILRPYVKGICASIETVEPGLHDDLCPDKPISPYSKMLKLAKSKGFRTSITIVIGIGEKKQDLKLLLDFIKEHNLDRITFYALKPIKGTDFENTFSPKIQDYAWWISQTRKAFPDIEIMAGLTPKKVDYVKDILEAGADGITKFPAISQFNSEKAKLIEKLIKDSGRRFISTLTSIPDINWNKEIDDLSIDKELKHQVKEKLDISLKQMKKRS